MACGDYGAYQEFWINGQFFDAVFCPFGDVLGGVGFALFVFGAIGLSLYIYSGSVVMPLVLTLILGSVVVTQLPSIAAQLVGAVVLLGIAIAGYLIVIRSHRLR
jgi:hypothetical protein